MRRIAQGAAPAVLLAIVACDKLPFIGQRSQPPQDTAQVAAPPPAAADTVPAPPPPEPAPVEPVATRPLVDEPWTPLDTGTVNPGMARDDVIAIWGVPVAERTNGAWTYLYFRNGCEVSCGTLDVVFLENGQVVDAVVRGPGHNYSGVSSSPPDRVPERTVPPAPIPEGAGG
jgi:hypothetical protein